MAKNSNIFKEFINTLSYDVTHFHALTPDLKAAVALFLMSVTGLFICLALQVNALPGSSEEYGQGEAQAFEQSLDDAVNGAKDRIKAVGMHELNEQADEPESICRVDISCCVHDHIFVVSCRERRCEDD